MYLSATFLSVGVENTIGASVGPAAIILISGGQTQQFTTTVTNTASQTVTWSSAPAGAAPPTLVASQTSTITANQNVTWVLSGPGSLSTAGPSVSAAYAAPASISAHQTAAVTATSQADPTKTASTTGAIVPISVTLAPRSEPGPTPVTLGESLPKSL